MRLGVILITAGCAVLLAYTGFVAIDSFFLGDEAPLIVKLGSGAMVVGAAVVLAFAVLDRVRSQSDDTYRDAKP